MCQRSKTSNWKVFLLHWLGFPECQCPQLDLAGVASLHWKSPDNLTDERLACSCSKEIAGRRTALSQIKRTDAGHHVLRTSAPTWLHPHSSWPLTQIKRTEAKYHVLKAASGANLDSTSWTVALACHNGQWDSFSCPCLNFPGLDQWSGVFRTPPPPTDGPSTRQDQGQDRSQSCAQFLNISRISFVLHNFRTQRVPRCNASAEGSCVLLYILKQWWQKRTLYP